MAPVRLFLALALALAVVGLVGVTATATADTGTVQRTFVFSTQTGNGPGFYTARYDGTDVNPAYAAGASYYTSTPPAYALSPDGRFIAFAEDCSRAQVDVLRRARSGDPATPATEDQCGFATQGIFTDDLDEDVGPGITGSDPARKLVVANGNSGGYSYNWASSTVQAFTSNGANLIVAVTREDIKQGSSGYDTYSTVIAKVAVVGGAFSVITVQNGVVSPDMTKVAYAQADSQGDTGLFVANVTGSSPKQITAYGSEPNDEAFSPDGTKIAYTVLTGTTYQIWVANINGTSAVAVTTLPNYAYVALQWTPTGADVLYVAKGVLMSVAPVAGGAPIPLLGTNSTLSVASFAQSPAASTLSLSSDDYLASQFEPLLDFDSTEKWRPLNVTMFLNETDPTSGAAWNQICNRSTLACYPLDGAPALRQEPSFVGYILQHHTTGDENSYESPNPSCQTTLGSTHVLDCNTGAATAVYYNIAGQSPHNYTYINYWFFYRNNQGFIDVGDHAGDWEGVTVAPEPSDATFAFAEFSEHGTWHSFLRDNLLCDGAPEYSCGSDAGGDQGHHVETFPAAGSHANYPDPATSHLGDNSSDGKVSWGRNWDPGTVVSGKCTSATVADPSNVCGPALIETPATAGNGVAWTAGPENWTDWPGLWGETSGSGGADASSPCGPAAPADPVVGCGADHGPHYYTPWSTAGNLECDGPAVDCPDLSQQNEKHEPLQCKSWFAQAVAALACNTAEMRRALTSRRLGRTGQMRLRLLNHPRGAARAPGLAQLVSRPAGVGDSLLASGEILRGTILSVRACEEKKCDVLRGHVTTARLKRVRIDIKQGRMGFPRAVTSVHANGLAVIAVDKRKR